MTGPVIGSAIGSGISFPPRLGPDGRWAWSGGEQNVRESIRVILMTELGERLRRPDFGAGLGRYLFEPNTVTTRRQIQDRIVKALALWEPRVDVLNVTVEADATDPDTAVATVVYRLVATGAQEAVTTSIRMSG
jgi:phage baseplate assembly protein W